MRRAKVDSERWNGPAGKADPGSHEDHEIIKKVMDGAVNEYRHLIEKYQVQLYNLFLRMLRDEDMARELTHQTFVKAYMALDNFRFEHRFFSWIYRIAINQALTVLRNRKRMVGLEEAYRFSGEDEAARKDDSSHLRMAVNRLNDKYKAVIELKYFQQMAYKDIAIVLNITDKKVKSRLFDARLQLRNILEETGYYD